MEIQKKVNLAPLTWWKVGGDAEYYCEPKSLEEVEEALLWAQTNGHGLTVLGGGSNVLISDCGIKGLVLSTKSLKGIESSKVVDDRLVVSCLAGTSKSDVTRVFLKEKLSAALFLCGLPGDMGGGVFMNAGVSEQVVPREFCEIVDAIEVVRIEGTSPARVRLKGSDIHWEYRHSSGWQPGVIAKVTVSWPMQPDEEIPKKVKMATRSRLQRQPLNMPSCGSVFKNPEGNASGALIEKAGLKGFQIGQAQVSEKHANFIVNLGGATATDVKSVIDHVKAEVSNAHGIDLTTEVRFLGEWA